MIFDASFSCFGLKADSRMTARRESYHNSCWFSRYLLTKNFPSVIVCLFVLFAVLPDEQARMSILAKRNYTGDQDEHLINTKYGDEQFYDMPNTKEPKARKRSSSRKNSDGWRRKSSSFVFSRRSTKSVVSSAPTTFALPPAVQLCDKKAEMRMMKVLYFINFCFKFV